MEAVALAEHVCGEEVGESGLEGGRVFPPGPTTLQLAESSTSTLLVSDSSSWSILILVISTGFQCPAEVQFTAVASAELASSGQETPLDERCHLQECCCCSRPAWGSCTVG